jgi:hypothetical protein
VKIKSTRTKKIKKNLVVGLDALSKILRPECLENASICSIELIGEADGYEIGLEISPVMLFRDGESEYVLHFYQWEPLSKQAT